MTPEEQAIREELIRRAQEQAARQLPPPPQDTTPQGAEVSERTPPPDDIRPPSQGAGGGGANALPPPIAIPERNVPRTGSEAGRKAHAVFGALLSPITGGNTFMRRVAREEAMGDRDYQDDLREYQLRTAQRDQQIKEGRQGQMLPPILAERMGLPEGTTVGDVQRLYQPMGWGSIVRQEEGAEQARGLEEMRQEGRSGLQEAKHGYRMEEIAARNRGRRSSGGGGSGGGGPLSLVSQAAGITEEQAREGLDDIAHGIMASDAAQRVMMATGNKAVKRIVGTVMQGGKVERRDTESSEKDLQKFYAGSADVRAGLRNWEQWKSKNADKIDQYVDEIRRLGYTAASDGAKDMITAMRTPVAGFLRKMAGAAMSPQEAGLQGGPFAELLINTSSGGWASWEGIAGKLEQWVSKQGARPEELFGLIDRVSDEADEQMKSMARAAPTAALQAMPREDALPVLQDRLREAAEAGKLDIPAGGKIAPSTLRVDGHRIRYEVIMPDGSRQEGSL